MEAIVSSPSLVGASRPPAIAEGEGMHTHVRVDDDAGTGDLSRRATGGDTPADTCSDTARISSTPWKFHESFARECRGSKLDKVT